MDDLKPGPASLHSECARGEAEPPSSFLHDAPLFRLFKGVHTALRHRALQQMRADGIDALFPGAAPLLLHLGEEDGLTLSELARRCELENSTLTPLVDELERQSLVARVRDINDRRVIRIRLTPAGHEMEPRLRALWLRLQEQALSGLSESEILSLYRTLDRVQQNLHNEI
jgi:DNA-binding MarR family transcriptional regulator